MFKDLFNNKKKQIEEAKIIVGKLMKNIKLCDDLMVFTMDLRDKYSDANDYELYHVLINSDLPDKDYVFPKYDFPEKDSILLFLKDKAEELGQEEVID
jgi:hypothetical protein